MTIGHVIVSSQDGLVVELKRKVLVWNHSDRRTE